VIWPWPVFRKIWGVFQERIVFAKYAKFGAFWLGEINFVFNHRKKFVRNSEIVRGNFVALARF